jgi:hypothetical protein
MGDRGPNEPLKLGCNVRQGHHTGRNTLHTLLREYQQ